MRDTLATAALKEMVRAWRDHCKPLGGRTLAVGSWVWGTRSLSVAAGIWARLQDSGAPNRSGSLVDGDVGSPPCPLTAAPAERPERLPSEKEIGAPCIRQSRRCQNCGARQSANDIFCLCSPASTQLRSLTQLPPDICGTLYAGAPEPLVGLMVGQTYWITDPSPEHLAQRPVHLVALTVPQSSPRGPGKR